MINPDPGFGPIFGPMGPTAGTGSLGTCSGSKTRAGCTKNQARSPFLSPIRGYFVFWDRPHDKFEAPQGLLI